jgi:two-component system, OmpR family, sensor histidine kinase KdpD
MSSQGQETSTLATAHLRWQFGRLWLQELSGWVHGTRAKLGGLKALCAGLIGMAVCTWLGFHAGLNLASSGFLYLVLIVLAAVYGGIWEATIASFVAVMCLDYFFVPPLFTFRVNDPRNWVALGAFEFTALVVSRFSNQAQARAAEAVRERRDTERLYQTSQQVLLLDRSREPGPWIPTVIRECFNIPGVLLFDAVAARSYMSGNVPAEAEEQTRNAYYSNSDSFDSSRQSWFCVLRLGARPVGGLGLCGCRVSPLVAAALASLSAIALERRRSFEKEFHAEAAREAEQLRTAVLDALAHQFKTPLATILTASSGLLAAGGLSDDQAELVALIDEEAGELNSLASRLLRAARLDGFDFKPKREPLLLSSLLDSVIETLKEQSSAQRFCISLPQQETPVMADRQLMTTVLSQILENAIKYSVPESPISVAIESRDGEVIVRVENQGLVIAPADRERIFERFYRGSGTDQRPAGTGLGLSIVKRIVEAHRGRVWAEGIADRGTAFSVALPAATRT